MTDCYGCFHSAFAFSFLMCKLKKSIKTGGWITRENCVVSFLTLALNELPENTQWLLQMICLQVWGLEIWSNRTCKIIWSWMVRRVTQGESGWRGGACSSNCSLSGLAFTSTPSLSFQVPLMLERALRHHYLLRVLLCTSMSVDDLLLIYFALIRLVLTFGHVPLVWCTKGQKEALEHLGFPNGTLCFSPMWYI